MGGLRRECSRGRWGCGLRSRGRWDRALRSRDRRDRSMRKRDSRGQGTLEAAFTIPVLFVLMLLLMQPGIILYDRMVMGAAATEGCRLLATKGASLGSMDGSCEAYIRHRLASIPQHDCFHVHTGGCSWQIEMDGGESSLQASVRITNEVRPLPLFDGMATLLGLTNSRGNLEVTVEASMPVQPAWVASALVGADPSGWIGAWSDE